MFATDILEVLYAPHKVFKKIVQNPKYWGPILVILLFTAAQTALFYSQYSRTYYEETSPAIGQLTEWTQSPSYWTASPNTTLISSNIIDIFNTTFYGNSSLEFDVTNSSTLSATLKNFTSVDCSVVGFQDLYLQLRILQPSSVPTSATVYLYSNSASNYFQYDLTPAFANFSLTEWNNLTIPVGSADWQSVGAPSWNNITSLKLDLTFPQSSDITVRIGGLFFRGLYHTPIESFGQVAFAANAMLSALFTFISQWLILSAVTYIVVKALKGTVTWRPLFVAMGIASVIFVVETLISLVGTATLPAQIHYPFEFSYGYQLGYSAQIVSLFSSASQTVYNAVIAPAVSTAILVSTVAVLAIYVWLTFLTGTIIRAMTEFSWLKSILGGAASVVLTYVILSLLYGLGIL